MHKRLPIALAVLVAASLTVASCSVIPGRRDEVAKSAQPPPQAEPAPSPQAEPAPSPSPKKKPGINEFMATAYSEEGKTASGGESREGIVAADPDVIPLGSRIRVRGAGEYSGVYRVKDTGKKISGREIDIYLDNDAEAQRFGKKRVTVEVLHEGSGAAEARRDPEPRPGTQAGH